MTHHTCNELRIAIYGNLIYDEIYILHKPFNIGHGNNCTKICRGGGILNLIRACETHKFNWKPIIIGDVGNDSEGNYIINKLENNLIKRSEHNTSKAAIIVDKFTNQRTALMAWGACRNKIDWPIVKADWHHIMYLDRLKIDLSTINGIISADICDIKLDSIKKQLKYIDYLFISDYQHNGKIPVKRGIISHSPDSIIYYTNNEMIEFKIIKEKGLNVLGAGDYLAASLITELYNSSVNLSKVHDQTVSLLRLQSDDNNLDADCWESSKIY